MVDEGNHYSHTMAIAQASLTDKSIRYAKGVGPQRMRQLDELGIQTIEDACFYPPRRYEDRSRILSINDVRAGETVTVRGRVLAVTLRRIRRGQSLVDLSISDGTGILHGVWFHQPYLAKQIASGEELIFYGKAEAGRQPQIIHPEMEKVEQGEDAFIHMGRITPVYPLTSGVSQRWLRKIIWHLLFDNPLCLEDILPASLRLRHQWPELTDAVKTLHFPDSWEKLSQARECLSFSELFLMQVALAWRRAKTSATDKVQRYKVDEKLTQALRSRLPFALTASQERVLSELLRDLSQPSPMHRLLQGDVGCGKTILIIFLLAAAVQSGYQAALMAPTELLAEQHRKTLEKMLGELGVSVGFLVQGISQAQRKRCLQDVAEGKIDILIGTHALIQTNVQFKQLALVVIDEQHKFGVIQRAQLARKAQTADVLVVTATPIPRTLALSIYGDLSISTINELPPGRSPIDTFWLRQDKRQELYELMRRQLKQARQAYIVYPLVEDDSTTELKAATRMAKHLQEDIFPEFSVGLLHGKLSAKEKEKRMSAFARGQTRLLVSTVIVEVGLDVPNATVMVIEHPERFGLAQLHQLRGRIGRGNHAATCFIISDTRDELAQKRLRAFVETTDGFQLAERDLEQRGPGELLGRRQHGWLRFRIADLSRDKALLELARQEADRLLEQDPQLAGPESGILKQRLARLRAQAS